MVGASAVISGFMAAAMRFAFQRGGPLELLRGNDDLAYRVKALSLGASLFARLVERRLARLGRDEAGAD